MDEGKVALPSEVRSECIALSKEAAQFRKGGEFIEAASTGERVLTLVQAWLGWDDPEVLQTLEWLVSTYRSAEDWNRAEIRCMDLLGWWQRNAGPEHFRSIDARLAVEHIQLLSRLSAAERLQLVEADSAIAIAQKLYSEGNYSAAIPFGEKAASIREKVLGDHDAHYAACLNDLGAFYLAVNDLSKAETFLERSLNIRQRINGDVHPATATTMNNLAELYRTTGNFVRARELRHREVEFAKQLHGELHPSYAISLSNHGSLCKDMGDYSAAESLYAQSLNIKLAAFGEQHPEYAKGLANLAELYREIGNFSEAEHLNQQALTIRKGSLGEQHPDYTTSLNNLGLLYYDMGRYAQAIPLHRQAISIRRKVHGANSAEYAFSLNNLGLVYQAMGDFARAEPILLEALTVVRSVLGDGHPILAPILNNLALVAQHSKNLSRAESLYRQSMAIRSKTSGEMHPAFATSLDNLGAIYLEIGDLARAEQHHLKAFEIRKEVLGENNADCATSLVHLATLYAVQGKCHLAISHLEKAHDIVKDTLGESSPDFARVLMNLAQAYDLAGDLRAETVFHDSMRITKGVIDGSAFACDEIGQLRLGQSVRGTIDACLGYLVRRGHAEAAYEVVLHWKGATLIRQHAARLAAEDDTLAPILKELQSTTRQWTSLMLAEPHDAGQRAERIGVLASRREQLNAELCRRDVSFRSAARECSIKEIQAALPSDAALVDFFEYWFAEPAVDQPGKYLGRRSLVAFVIRQDHPVEMFDLRESRPIQRAVEQWRSGFGTTEGAVKAGQILREAIWMPIAQAIGDSRFVLISPDGPLSSLPFAALPGKRPGSFLIEEFAMGLLPVPQLIHSFASAAQMKELPKGLLVMGGVDYEHRALSPTGRRSTDKDALRDEVSELVGRELLQGVIWNYLPGTEVEANSIKELYLNVFRLPRDTDRVVHLLGAEATEEQFREFAPKCAILHLATHGYFAPADKLSAFRPARPGRLDTEGLLTPDRLSLDRAYNPGLLSGLVFAGANSPPEISEDQVDYAEMHDDGILTADDIASLQLRGVRLVVLSACETGLGEVAGGESLLGVQRAFQVAGASTTVATLWKVDDDATRRIMEEFYRNYLERQMSPLEALRAAQLWALNNLELAAGGVAPRENAGATRRLPPRYWAAFTLSGDWR